jgi:hypothetical protein
MGITKRIVCLAKEFRRTNIMDHILAALLSLIATTALFAATAV